MGEINHYVLWKLWYTHYCLQSSVQCIYSELPYESNFPTDNLVNTKMAPSALMENKFRHSTGLTKPGVQGDSGLSFVLRATFMSLCTFE